MAASHTTMRSEQNTPLHEVSFHGVDVGWMIELVGASASWFLNEPRIALFALAGKGLLQLYHRYLNQLPAHYRMQHVAVRNTLLGSGALMAAPLMSEGAPLQWLLACLIGCTIAWIVLVITGCMKSSCSTAHYHE